MPADEPVIPSDKALAELRTRIESDDELEQEVRDALLEDLASENPSAFEYLKAVLTEEVHGDEAEKPKSQ